ncbi:SOS response regulatory protein OraA/RecX [Nocardia neocaledoniensis]|uniref:Regulatory protein RecX n=1 Tax=Nocardia neocaledoniensis TaxID=236511 RepID=A0A317P1Z7_9NOCA|nr:SOS response regulatory protein OraA/RecX [Nocardia neocaledoniensis]
MAAGSQPGEPDRRAGTRRLAPGDRPAATVDQAKDACLNLLAVRARSRAELAKRLGEKGFRVEVTEAALDRLAEVGLVDDSSFAEQWVHERHTYSGRGKRALQRELRDKGVAPADAENALAVVTDDAERARATDLVRRKVPTLPRDLDRDKAVRRLVGMLARRGYDQSTAFAVVSAELAEAGFVRAPSEARRPGSGQPEVPAPGDADAEGSGDDGMHAEDDGVDGRREEDVRQGAGPARRQAGGWSRGGGGFRAATPTADVGPDDAEPDDTARRHRARPVPGDEQDAVDLVRRKLRAMPADLGRAKATRRLVDMLARRGYDPSTAYAVVKAELAEQGR